MATQTPRARWGPDGAAIAKRFSAGRLPSWHHATALHNHAWEFWMRSDARPDVSSCHPATARLTIGSLALRSAFPGWRGMECSIGISAVFFTICLPRAFLRSCTSRPRCPSQRCFWLFPAHPANKPQLRVRRAGALGSKGRTPNSCCIVFQFSKTSPRICSISCL